MNYQKFGLKESRTSDDSSRRMPNNHLPKSRWSPNFPEQLYPHTLISKWISPAQGGCFYIINKSGNNCFPYFCFKNREREKKKTFPMNKISFDKL